MPYAYCGSLLLARSRMVPKSGIMPMYQNTTEMVAYVETANTSHNKGERNCGHTFMVLGQGKTQSPSHGRPTWISGNMPAQTTAKMVIASAKRLIEFRHCCLNNSKIAEISVPAWPIPIHQTKLIIAKPQPTGISRPQIPTPFRNSQVTAVTRIRTIVLASMKPANQPIGVCGVSTMREITSVTDLKVYPGAITRNSPVTGSSCGSLTGNSGLVAMLR